MKGNISLAWLAVTVCLSSCGSDGSQYEPPPAEAPIGLSYPDPNMFIQGTAITPLVPMVTGKPTSYWVTPDLPAGLRLEADGEITGTPTEPKSPATYLVTAGNAAGTTSFGVRITVSGRFTVGGTVSGLSGTGLVLSNNGTDNLAVNADGPFTFSKALPAGGGYSVSVATQPTGQTCAVSQGSGSITNDNFNRVAVTCAANTPKARITEQSIAPLLLACLLPGDLVFEFETEANAVPGNASSTYCGAYSITPDADGKRVFVTNVVTGIVSVYSTL